MSPLGIRRFQGGARVSNMGNGPPEDGQYTVFKQSYRRTETAKHLLRRNSWHRRRQRVGNKVIRIRGTHAV